MKAIQGYAPINGLKMYYEIAGSGDPLVYIHPALGFAGLNPFPSLAQNHKVITMDLQGHGRTADVPGRALSLQQHAKDIVGLLKHLGISKADFFGESYGGAIASLIALYHPELVDRVATYGATFGPPEAALNMEMLRMTTAPSPHSEAFRFQRENYERVAPHPEYWPEFWEKAVTMKWDGFSNEELASIEAPLLIALGDHDFVALEHALDTFRRIPNAELAVIPDAGHFALYSEPERVIPVVENFLSRPRARVLIATAGMGYQPGRTR